MRLRLQEARLPTASPTAAAATEPRTPMSTARKPARPRRQPAPQSGNTRRPNRKRGPLPDRRPEAVQAVAAPRTRAGSGRLRGIGRRAARVGLRAALTGGLVYGLLMAAQGVYEYATTASRFEVRGLVYEPTRHLDDDRVRELLALEPGTNLLSLDLEQLGERVAADPWVARATVTRQLPDTLEVAVQEHEPAALVLAGKLYLANTEGVLFKEVERHERGDLPVVTGIAREQLVEDREAAQARVREALEVLAQWQTKQRPRLSELHLGESGAISLYTAESGTQLRLGRGGVEPKLARFDALRAAIGDKADALAVVHLDSGSTPNRPDRIVARFFDEQTEAVLLAEAQIEQARVDQKENPTAGRAASQDVKDRAPKKRRIPRHH